MSALVICLIVLSCCVFSLGAAWLLFRTGSWARLTHTAAKTEVVTDLDAILGRTVGVRFNGRVHRIPPLSVENFLAATNAMAELEMLMKERIVSIEQVRQAYFRLFEICCPSLAYDKGFDGLNNQQMAALYKTVFDQVTGKPSESQKKSLEAAKERSPA